MGEQERHLMILVQLVHLLDKGQTSEKPPGLINTQGLIICPFQALKGAERIEGIKMFPILRTVILLQEHIIGNIPPFLLNQLLSKRLMHGIGVGKTAVADLDQMPLLGSPAPVGDTAEEQGLPVGLLFQRNTGFAQGAGIKTLKKNIVLKNEDIGRVSPKSFAQAEQMRLKDPLFRGQRMLFHQDELDPVQQADRSKFLPGCGSPILPLTQGDAVNPVKKGPAIELDKLDSVFHRLRTVLC